MSAHPLRPAAERPALARYAAVSSSAPRPSALGWLAALGFVCLASSALLHRERPATEPGGAPDPCSDDLMQRVCA